MKEPASPARKRGRPRTGTPSGREILLAAAMRAFARHGFEGTSLRTIADDAGVDMALTARLFGSKLDLWKAVVESLAQSQADHREHIRQIVEAPDATPSRSMVRFIRLFADISFQFPELCCFFMQEISNPGERLEMIQAVLIRPFTELSLPIVEAAMRAGAIRAQNPELFLKMLFAAISTPMILFRDADMETMRDSLANEAITILMRSD